MSSKALKVWLTPFNIALVYTVLGGVWIFFADMVMAFFITEAHSFSRAKILSQWAFIVVSGQALYWLLRHREAAVERSQETLYRVNRALRFFIECNKAITWGRDEPELLRKVCRVLVMLGGYRLAWVGFARQSAEKTVQPMAFWGYDEGYLANLKVTWDHRPGAGGHGDPHRADHGRAAHPHQPPLQTMARRGPAARLQCRPRPAPAGRQTGARRPGHPVR